MKKSRNRRVGRTYSVVVAGVGHLAAIGVAVFVVGLMNVLANTSCKQLIKTIGEEGRQLAKLEDACMRESTRWEEMKTPEKIERALLRHGLSMKPPRADQIVHMRTNGQPYPGQLSVARARQRQSVKTAQVRTGR